MAVETHPDHPANGLEVVEGNAEYHRSTAEVDDVDWSGRDHRGYLISPFPSFAAQTFPIAVSLEPIQAHTVNHFTKAPPRA